jgi:hypothetical protein
MHTFPLAIRRHGSLASGVSADDSHSLSHRLRYAFMSSSSYFGRAASSDQGDNVAGAFLGVASYFNTGTEPISADTNRFLYGTPPPALNPRTTNL